MTDLAAQPQIGIVILNWNNAEDTITCLNSVKAYASHMAHTIVVDNGSTDTSFTAISRAHPDVELIETGANLGYAGGNNVGIKRALEHGAKYIVVLNNDVVVTPNFLEPLISALESDPRAGVATPLISDGLDGHSVWALGSHVDRHSGTVFRIAAGDSLEAVRSQGVFDVDAASGAAMLVRSEVFKSVGMLDELYFLYYEETDWSLRVRQGGYRIVAVPEALVFHKVSATLGQSSPYTDYYMTRNRLRFITRNWSGFQRVGILVKVFVRELVTILAYTVRRRNGERLPHRNARVHALMDAVRRKWGPSTYDVARLSTGRISQTVLGTD